VITAIRRFFTEIRYELPPQHFQAPFLYIRLGFRYIGVMRQNSITGIWEAEIEPKFFTVQVMNSVQEELKHLNLRCTHG